MKIKLLLITMLLAQLSFSQVTYAVKELTGIIEAIEPDKSFELEAIKVKVGDESQYFRIPPSYGKNIISKLHVGEWLTFKVNVNLKRDEMKKNVSQELIDRWFRDSIVEIMIQDKWISCPEISDDFSHDRMKVILDKKVESEYWYNGYRYAIIYEKNKAAFYVLNNKNYQPLKNVTIGDVVSFIGISKKSQEGYIYPVENISTTCSFRQLYKEKGIITSFLFKQNYACIGLVLQSSKGTLKLSFPSDLAEKIKFFSGNNQNVTVYYDDYKIEKQLEPPPLHALVFGSDTIRIENLFYGGADVQHDHQPTEVRGKISHISKSDNGRIISLVIGNDCYIEIDHNTAVQLGNTLKNGREIIVEGDERVKIKGEIYSRPYRIITPKQITIDGKLYLTN